MDNGFDEVILALKEEGEIKSTLNCIRAYQEHYKCTFDEAADILNVSNKMRIKIKNSLLEE